MILVVPSKPGNAKNVSEYYALQREKTLFSQGRTSDMVGASPTSESSSGGSTQARSRQSSWEIIP